MFYKINDQLLTAAVLEIVTDQSALMTVKIDCLAGKVLRSEPVADLTVSAKQMDQADFADLESSGLPLGAWNGARETFVIKFEAASGIVSINWRAFKLTVENS